jgi:hypothetical protein
MSKFAFREEERGILAVNHEGVKRFKLGKQDKIQSLRVSQAEELCSVFCMAFNEKRPVGVSDNIGQQST